MYIFIKHKVTSNIHKYSNQNSTIHKYNMRNSTIHKYNMRNIGKTTKTI